MGATLLEPSHYVITFKECLIQRTVCVLVCVCMCVYACVQACMSIDLPGEESKTKMGHMSKMFQMYSTKNFTNGRDLWLAGICRYLSDVYTPLAVKVSRKDMLLQAECTIFTLPLSLSLFCVLL